ncbi:SDR family NAD(P)-dependent oxidoreductase [Oceaniglobus ichthyenteri]|uniref:SDR family NAD(P)-dependent oxidoreductase n=1 Tax=Oceaniglobus ichthyenteri TaxID=2136177 RepID=UPI000D347EC9|nr:SDR family oxidoreductase [Oceaniglobus ichthyenteri]
MDPLFDLSGRVACVTGASSGLGRAAATALAARGARVVGVARRADKLTEWVENTPGQTAMAVGDVADRDALSDLVARVSYPFGAPDILINAAGINTRQAADDVTAEGWDATLALNLSAPFFLAQAFVPAMKARKWGRIVNFASLQSRRAFAGGIAYGATKGGVEQLTRAMAEAWSRDGIMCNAVAPGFVRTELTGPVFANPDIANHHANATCIGRNGEVDDMEGPMIFLCSPASNYVTGQVLFVDGGYTAK